jgi:IS1 family transposase
MSDYELTANDRLAIEHMVARAMQQPAKRQQLVAINDETLAESRQRLAAAKREIASVSRSIAMREELVRRFAALEVRESVNTIRAGGES